MKIIDRLGPELPNMRNDWKKEFFSIWLNISKILRIMNTMKSKHLREARKEPPVKNGFNLALIKIHGLISLDFQTAKSKY